MNGAEVYASRMMLLLVPVSASALSRCSSLLTMRLTSNSVVGHWKNDFSGLVLLELNGLEEVNKYSFFSPSSILVVKLTSLERMDSAFLVPLLTACSLFRLQLPFEWINFFEKNKKGQRLLCKPRFGFLAKLFLLFEFGNRSTISRFIVVLVIIVTPHVGLLMILRRLAYTTGNRYSCLIIYWKRGRIQTVGAPDLLQVLQTLEKRN
jgi:hypothetical protein